VILIAYDGSDDARKAVRAAVELFSEPAVVLCVHTPATDEAAAQADTSAMPAASDDSHSLTRVVAAEGAELARAAGLEAEPVVAEGGGVAAVANAIVRGADEHQARAILVGRRGRSKLQSVVLGSVSSAVVERATRPVLVVPSRKH